MLDTIKKIPAKGLYILLAYMPLHIFISQWMSTFTGGLNGWKVAKDVATMVLVWLAFGLVVYTKSYRKTPYFWFVGAAFVYLALHIFLYFSMNHTTQEVAALATVYNNRLIWYFIVGMSAALLTPKLFSTKNLASVMLIVSSVVCIIGLLQFVLPPDTMTNFGYSVERGVKPMFFIDDKPDLPRVFSTIRDPNSLGAFLIVPITFIWSLLFVREHRDKRIMLAGLLLLHGLVLLLTFSRAAWIGVVISVAVVSWLQYKSWIRRNYKTILLLVLILFSSLAGVAYVLRDQYFVQNVIFHSDESTQAELDSNALHIKLAEEGFKEFKENPIGDGPGTAGIVSIQNDEKVLLTENYYIQILHEVGVVGLLIFIAGFLYILYLLKKNKSAFGITLLASGVAYAAMSLVMHLWTNEAVAAQWWILSGVAVVWAFKARGSLGGDRDKAKNQPRKQKPS